MPDDLLVEFDERFVRGKWMLDNQVYAPHVLTQFWDLYGPFKGVAPEIEYARE